MTPEKFRQLALSLPDATEASHMGHPDFRVGGKVFATIGYPDARYAMLKLIPEQQAKLVAASPDMFTPVPGGWGRRGSTNVILAAASTAAVKSALAMAWENIAPNAPPSPSGHCPNPVEPEARGRQAHSIRPEIR
jgi:hypothetical protein